MGAVHVTKPETYFVLFYKLYRLFFLLTHFYYCVRSQDSIIWLLQLWTAKVLYHSAGDGGIGPITASVAQSLSSNSWCCRYDSSELGTRFFYASRLRFRALWRSSSRWRFCALFWALNFALLLSRSRAPWFFALFFRAPRFFVLFFALLNFSRSYICDNCFSRS
jgi:hypothetical protein